MTSGKKKESDMSHLFRAEAVETPGVPVEWSNRSGFQPFGDRLNFLSPERAHLHTGRLRILPPLEVKKRNGRAS